MFAEDAGNIAFADEQGAGEVVQCDGFFYVAVNVVNHVGVEVELGLRESAVGLLGGNPVHGDQELNEQTADGGGAERVLFAAVGVEEALTDNIQHPKRRVCRTEP